MICPICKRLLEEMFLSGVIVNYCPICLGLWFEEDELSQAKDNRDRDLRWLDIDLWQDKEKFRIAYGVRLCPSCRLPLYEVYYGNSGIIVDVCNLCHGVWLDKGEFRKIVAWMKKKADYDILNNYLKNLIQETVEIFIGPENFRDEVIDFLTILKVFNYKFAVQHPLITEIISNLLK